MTAVQTLQKEMQKMRGFPEFGFLFWHIFCNFGRLNFSFLLASPLQNRG
jgi:hypothetical protein